jgi:hypothetical protein
MNRPSKGGRDLVAGFKESPPEGRKQRASISTLLGCFTFSTNVSCVGTWLDLDPKAKQMKTKE